MEWFLVLLIVTFSCVASQIVDYSDLETMGVSCQPRDTCSRNGVRTFFTSNCECDSSCHFFGDCCVDAYSSRNQNRVGRSRLGIKCLPLDTTQGVYVLGKCARAWSGSSEIQQKCENLDDFSDPLASLPATDTLTNVTYLNRYCAECNYARLENISSWDPKLTCSSLEDINRRFDNITQNYITQNIIRVGGSWGVYHWDESIHGMLFYPCNISVHVPDNLRPHIRFCRPHLKSQCSSNWNRRAIRNKCSRYMAVIYIEGQAYRNAHCALCNRVSLIANRTCDPIGVHDRKTPPSLSFTLLLDVNPSDGDEVGRSNSCSSGEKYDPFFDKCRALVCAMPGHTFRNNRCVPE